MFARRKQKWKPGGFLYCSPLSWKSLLCSSLWVILLVLPLQLGILKSKLPAMSLVSLSEKDKNAHKWVFSRYYIGANIKEVIFKISSSTWEYIVFQLSWLTCLALSKPQVERFKRLSRINLYYAFLHLPWSLTSYSANNFFPANNIGFMASELTKQQREDGVPNQKVLVSSLGTQLSACRSQDKFMNKKQTSLTWQILTSEQMMEAWVNMGKFSHLWQKKKQGRSVYRDRMEGLKMKIITSLWPATLTRTCL